MADTMPGRTWSLSEHSLRRSLAGEVHARPYEQIAAPVRASHLAIVHDGLSAAEERTFLNEVLAIHGAEAPADSTNHFTRDLGALRLRWERHTEFSTYTFLRFDAFEAPFAEPALALVPVEWLERLPGKVMVATHLAAPTTSPSCSTAIPWWRRGWWGPPPRCGPTSACMPTALAGCGCAIAV